MNEIKKPSFKAENFPGRWKELLQYIYATVDQLNWIILTLKNQQDWQKKKSAPFTKTESQESRQDDDNVLCSAQFDRMGRTVQVIVKVYKKDGVSAASGSVDVAIPKGFFPAFYDEDIPILTGENFTFILKNNKITIDYDFESEATKLGGYFSYVT